MSGEFDDLLTDPPFERLWDEDDSFVLTDQHVNFIRKARLVWDGTESGAPMLSPITPYGQTDILAQIISETNCTDRKSAVDFHISMVIALSDFCNRGELAAGEYALKNISAKEITQQMDGYGIKATQMGLSPKGLIRVDEPMVKLVKGVHWEWSNRWENEDRLAIDEWPGPAIDPKRPYGDMSYIQLDMHRILAWPVEKKTPDGFIALTDQQDDQLQALHLRLLGVMQVFLEQAQLP